MSTRKKQKQTQFVFSFQFRYFCSFCSTRPTIFQTRKGLSIFLKQIWFIITDFWKMAEEGLLLPASSTSSSSSLLSEISNACTRPFVLAFIVGSCGAFAFGCIVSFLMRSCMFNFLLNLIKMLLFDSLCSQIGYSAPTQTSIMKDLNLSIADASSITFLFFCCSYGLFRFISGSIWSWFSFLCSVFTIWIDIDGGVNPWSINLWEVNRFSWSCQSKFLLLKND